MQVDIDDMIDVEIVCLQTVVLCYYGGCDRLVVTVCHWLVAVCYQEWLCTTEQQLCTIMDRQNCVLFDDIVLISMETITSVGDDCHLDGQLVC